jgi:DNA repair photolyase
MERIKMELEVIYKPVGKAGEYTKLALNLYKGCGHGCIYCYAPACIHISRRRYNDPSPRKDVLEKIEADASRLQESRERAPIFLSLSCDPYQPIDEEYELTRQAIKILHDHDLRVMILTKGGLRAERDFDILSADDWFGVTLTNLDDSRSRQWEPVAALPLERIRSLENAHDRGIRTWVSLEPVLYPDTAIEIIYRTHPFVDMFKAGTLNYHPHARGIDWHRFAEEVERVFIDLGCDYYLKDDLQKYLVEKQPVAAGV